MSTEPGIVNERSYGAPKLEHIFKKKKKGIFRLGLCDIVLLSTISPPTNYLRLIKCSPFSIISKERVRLSKSKEKLKETCPSPHSLTSPRPPRTKDDPKNGLAAIRSITIKLGNAHSASRCDRDILGTFCPQNRRRSVYFFSRVRAAILGFGVFERARSHASRG